MRKKDPLAGCKGVPQTRDELYASAFGKQVTASHELQPAVPHIDVYVFPANGERGFFTVVTAGMSEFQMPVPTDVEFKRAELILYVDNGQLNEAVDLLRWLAHLVHDQKTWISAGSTMTNGQPPRPIFKQSQLDCFLFLPPLLEPDASLGDKFVIDSDRVGLLWVVPITTPECALIRDKGLSAFLDLLDGNDHPVSLNVSRISYV